MKKPIHPNFITVVSLPAFLLGGILAGTNWINMGQQQKGNNTIKNSFWGTVFIALVMLFTPKEVVVKMWPVWVGINAGVGMALRKLQLPAYEIWRTK